MKYSTLPIGIVTVLCILTMVGCATRPPEYPREAIVFDYTPASQAAPGSADVTFAVVGTRLGAPAPQGMMQLPSQVQAPFFVDFATTMTKDFMEVLGAHGYGVRGPFKTYDEMVHPDKEGSNLILTAEVVFTTDTSSAQVERVFHVGYEEVYAIRGPVTVNYDVNLVIHESLTNERMWQKSITIEPFTVQLKSYYGYTLQDLAERSAKYGKVFQMTGGVPIEVLLEKENKFHADLGYALKAQYNEILGKIYDYLDPREMAIVKNQAAELRKRKVY